ncbi:MAG TPA: COX15/CtaA family protein [Candidatus Angelobacter sp.]|nr:COX15/CtaA family protein [Candidatus Angelobacter sp.]
MTRSTDNPRLARFAAFTAAATLVLICFGGLVTSHGAGMAVPDWPNTFGYNPFFFPISKWVGNIFYEHTHRLVASGVGLLTTILAVWLWLKESRRWLRWLGVAAFFAIVLQGVLGGLRVVLFKDELGIFHATLGQLFFVLTAAIALFTNRWWASAAALQRPVEDSTGLRRLFLVATFLIFGQLMLGATMRHQHAGLAIPDFPAAYGKVWPATDADSIIRYNQNRVEINAVNPITAFQVVLQMVHRIVALAILCMVALAAWLTRRNLGWQNPLARISTAWLVLIMTQILLGAGTIWTGKSADVATAHVAVGALSLMTGAMLSIVSFRCLVRTAMSVQVAAKGESGAVPFAGGANAAPNVR